MVLSEEPLRLSGIAAGCDPVTPPELGHLEDKLLLVHDHPLINANT